MPDNKSIFETYKAFRFVLAAKHDCSVVSFLVRRMNNLKCIQPACGMVWMVGSDRCAVCTDPQTETPKMLLGEPLFEVGHLVISLRAQSST